MRRWNGWGDDMIDFTLNTDMLGFLRDRIGAGAWNGRRTSVAEAGAGAIAPLVEYNAVAGYARMDAVRDSEIPAA